MTSLTTPPTMGILHATETTFSREIGSNLRLVARKPIDGFAMCRILIVEALVGPQGLVIAFVFFLESLLLALAVEVAP